jgi:nitroreductase
MIEKAIELAIAAPNHKQTWPWRFYLTSQNTRQKLANLAVKFKEMKDGGTISEVAKNAVHKKYFESAELMILAIARSEDETQAKEDYASLACGVQNMSLYFHSEGIGTKWSTGKVTQSAETYQVLGLDSAKIELCGFLWIGKATSTPPKTQRPPASEFLKTI